MFDMEPDDSGWEPEMTKKEVLSIINDTKRAVITQYKLIVVDSKKLLVETPCGDIPIFDKNMYRKQYEAAQLCLGPVVFTAKTLTPKKYHYLYSQHLENWL